ncbi:hypothetical protein BASA50_006619 [Batrachochytrium salamandrivorans]|uniref:IQCH-like ATP-grasp domain-containing protein n=1 Tax=Batrachochytrium salamandrivorans TaxID=1357716 RepID=A0ABQ8FCB1_9FUNG|nr:hypothetical protein BASA50_006619 [Batrachochytrium salamandrivorans]
MYTRYPNIETPQHRVEFEQCESRRPSAGSGSVSHVDLSSLVETGQPDMYSQKKILMPLNKGEMISLNTTRDLSPVVSLQTVNSIVHHSSKTVTTNQKTQNSAFQFIPSRIHTAHIQAYGVDFNFYESPKTFNHSPQSKDTLSGKTRELPIGRLKSARLSSYSGKPSNLRDISDTLSIGNAKKEDSIDFLLSCGQTTHGLFYKNCMGSLSETIVPVRRAITAPIDMERSSIFQPLTKLVMHTPRPKTTFQKPVHRDRPFQGLIGNIDLNKSILNKEAALSIFNRESKSDGDLMQAHITSVPTPCPSDSASMELPAIKHTKSLQKRQSELQTQSITSHRKFIISMGRVVHESEAYSHFLHIASGIFPETFVAYVIEKLEIFCTNHCVHQAECSFERIIATLSKPSVQLHITDMDLLDCFENYSEINKAMLTVGQRFKGKHACCVAATLIQSMWRMYTLRSKHIVFISKLHVAKRLVKMWRIRRHILNIRQSLKKHRLEKIQLHIKKHSKFCAEWKAIKETQRLVDALNKNLSVVYVTTLLPHEIDLFLKQVIGHTLDLDELIQSNRILLILLERPVHFSETVSLTTILMYNTSAIRKLSEFIKNKLAYIVPGVYAWPELELSLYLNVPVFGSFEGFQKLSHKRSAQRELVLKSGAASAPGANIFTDEMSLYTQIDTLLSDNPNIARWVLKMNTEMEGRGLAYFDVKDIYLEEQYLPEKDIVSFPGAARQSNSDYFQDSSIHSLKNALSRHIQFCRKDIWISWNHFMRSFLLHGGVIEACPPVSDPETDSVEYPIAHLVIDPDGVVNLLVTGSLLVLDQFKPWGSIFPQMSIPHHNLVSSIEKLAQECVSQGIIGHVTLEFVSWRLADMHDRTTWCTSVKPHFTENLSQAYYMLFISCCQAVHTDGKIYFDMNSTRHLILRYLNKVPFVDMDKVRKGSQMDHINSNIDYEARVGIYTTKVTHQNFEILTRQRFHSICLESGISFDFKCKVGTHIPLVESFEKQSYAMMCVNRSLETVLEVLLHNLVILARKFTGTVHVTSNFMKASHYLAKLLSNVRPFSYVHKPAIIKNLGQLSDLEIMLNKHLCLPVSRIVGISDDDLVKSSTIKLPQIEMSPETVTLLNTEIPSKALSGFYMDFGREKLEMPVKSSPRNATRVPLGLHMNEYLVIMEHFAGLDTGLTDPQIPNSTQRLSNKKWVKSSPQTAEDHLIADAAVVTAASAIAMEDQKTLPTTSETLVQADICTPMECSSESDGIDEQSTRSKIPKN